MRGVKGTAGAGLLFLDFRKLLQHDLEIHLQRLKEVCMHFISDDAFSLSTSKSDVPLAQQGDDVPFGYLSLGFEFALELA